MKWNKKAVAINVLATLLITETAMARISGERKPSASSGGTTSSGKGQPSNMKVTEAPKSNFQVVQTADTVNCSSDQDVEKYFPLELFTHLSRDEGAGIDIQVRPGNKVVVKVPPTINVCGTFTPELRQDNDTKNVTILMKLFGTKKEVVEVNGVKTIKETKDTLLSHKDLEDCLAENKILVDGKIDYDKIPPKGYSESISTFDYDFDSKKDAKNTVTVSYAYPRSYMDPNIGYKPLYGFEERASVPGEACMRAEKIADATTFINKGQDVLIEEINAICEGGSAQQIAAARKSLGNADALKDIADKIKAEMDARYLIAVKEDVKNINAAMTKIEDKLNNGRDTLTEVAAKKLVNEYAELANDLDTKFLNPAIYRLDTLVQRRTALDDDAPQAKELDAEINTLNEDIAQFSKRNPTSLNSVYAVMEKFAINDSAKSIESILLKSNLYGRVYTGPIDEKRGKPLTFETASQQHAVKLSKFDRVLNDWTDTYLVGKGSMLPIQRTERERQSVIDRMNSRYAAFEKKEMSDYNSYCAMGMLGSVKNPVKCKDFVNGRERRLNTELKKRQKDLIYIKGKNDKLTKMGSSYNDYNARMLASQDEEADRYEPYASSYSGYEDTFNERFTTYNGPMTSTAYDASFYNMGGISAGMNMGQPQMQMAQQQMYNPQQGYQHQMPQVNQMSGQQMMGAWPSLN